jgi:hypothetical protein
MQSDVDDGPTWTPVFRVPVFPGPGFSKGIALRDYKRFAYGRLSPFELQKY